MRVLSKLTTVLLLAGASMFTTVASATETLGDECSATVWDGTASKSLDTGAIDSQIQKLEKLGADVRVRTYDSLSIGFVDSKFEGLLASCESWQALDGTIKSGLIVYMLTPEESLFVSGPTWDDEISASDADAIRTVINEQSTDTEAIVAGISETTDELDGAQLTDPVVLVPLFLASFLLLAGLLFVGLKMMRKRRDERERLETAKSQAYESRDNIKDAIGAFEIDPDSDEKLGIVSDFELLSPSLNTTDRQVLGEKVLAAEIAGDEVLKKNILLTDDRATNLEILRTVEEYEFATVSYRHFLEEVKSAQYKLDDASTSIQHIQDQIEQAPIRAVALRTQLNETLSLQNSLVLDGFKTPEEEVLIELGNTLGEADRKIAQKQHGQVIGDLEIVAVQLQRAAERLTGLQTIRRELIERHQAISKTYAYAVVEAGESGQVLEDMKVSFAMECWKDLLPDQSDAVQSLADADASLRSAAQKMSMESQEWQQSDEYLDTAEEGVEKVIQVTENVKKRASDLSATKSQAPSETRELLADIASFVQRVLVMKGVQSNNEEMLNQMAIQVNELRDSLDSGMPNYLSIERQLQSSQESFSDIQRLAMNEHQSALAAEQAEVKRAAEAEAEKKRRRRQNSSGGFGTGGSTFDSTPPRRRSSGGGFSLPSRSAKPTKSSSSSSRRSSGTRSSSGGRKSSGRRR